MQRIGIRLKVRVDKLDEYRRLHNPIWPELTALLRDSGISNYSLWLDTDGTEFGYIECEDWDDTCRKLANADVHTRWQTLMQDYLESAADASMGGQPVRRLEHVFQLAVVE